MTVREWIVHAFFLGVIAAVITMLLVGLL